MKIINQETELVDVRSLKPHPKNPNKGNTDLIAESIHENGFFGVIVAQRSSGHILVGHHRLEAAQQLGAKEVPVTWVDVDDTRALKIMLADNKTAEAAHRDEEKLAELLSELQLADTLTGTGYIDADLDALLASISATVPTLEPAEAPEPQLDRAEELRAKWKTERGQLWVIPSRTTPGKAHRLLCGDSTVAEDVARLMDGHRANAVFTDPPYGVDYSGQAATMFYGEGKAGKPRKKIENDSSLCLSMDILADALVLFPSDILFVWHAPQFQPDVFAVVKRVGWTPFVSIVWNKNVANFAALGATYKAKYEMAIGCKKDRIPFYGPNNEVTVWDIDRASVNEWHPTQKPVALFERLINNHTRIGEICAEPFVGGGSQFIAAEQTARLCYGMELEPKYIAVTLERLSGMGLTPELQ